MNQTLTRTNTSSWEVASDEFHQWLNNRESLLEPALAPDPTIKVLAFLALLDSDKPCTCDDLREIFKKNKVIKGFIHDNTLRPSVLSLGKTLNKFEHPLQLKSFKGRFQLIKRTHSTQFISTPFQQNSVILLDDPAIDAKSIAKILAQKAMLPVNSLYFLEWSARWWETFSSKEAEIRINYEADAWERLGIKNRLVNSNESGQILCVLGLAPGEGLAEIELLKRILNSSAVKIHYLAIDSSQRLLRDHIGLLKETLAPEIEADRLLCAGAVADIFSGLSETIAKAKNTFKARSPHSAFDFFSKKNATLVTYLGNCLGNSYQDQETEFFSMIYNILSNRPLEILVGVSVMRNTPDIYKRNWDDFLLQTPRHLLETKKLLRSLKPIDNMDPPEFILSEKDQDNDRCPPVTPEPYIVRHQIKGQIYRFFYKLAFDLELLESQGSTEAIPYQLPKGTLILLYNIIKYDMQTLVNGIEKGGLFKIKYDPHYHQVVDTSNGKREYAVFTAYV